MQGISRKMELTLTPPSPEDARDEETRLLEAIREAWDGGDAEPEEMGNGGEETPIRFQYKALQSLHASRRLLPSTDWHGTWSESSRAGRPRRITAARWISAARRLCSI